MKNPLELELETYEANKPQLLAESEGKVVLIKGKEIVGVFETEDEATEAGFDRFGYDTPILVKKILKQEPFIRIKGINAPWYVTEEDAEMAG